MKAWLGEGNVREAESEPNRGFLLNGIYPDKSFHMRCPDKQTCLTQVSLIPGPRKQLLEMHLLCTQGDQKQIYHKANELNPRLLASQPQVEAQAVAPGTHSQPFAFVNLAVVRFYDLFCLRSLPLFYSDFSLATFSLLLGDFEEPWAFLGSG